MAVVSVKEIADGAEAKISLPFDRSYTRVFRVRTDDPRDDGIVVGLAAGLPKPFDYYVNLGGSRYDPLSLLVDITPRREPIDHFSWLVTCSYRTTTGQVGTDYGGDIGGGDGGQSQTQGQGTLPQSPEQRPWSVSWSTETMRLPLKQAFTENGDISKGAVLKVAVVNAALEPFDPVPEYDAGYLVLTIKRLQLSFDPQQAKQYTFALNSETFLGFALPGQAQITLFTGDRTYVGGRPYWEQTLRIRFVPDGWKNWQPQILNMGLHRLPKNGEPDYVGGGGIITAAPDAAGAAALLGLAASFPVVGLGVPSPSKPILDGLTKQPISTPVMLDLNGQPLSDTAKKAGEVVYLEFARYPLRPFAKLKLT